VDSLLALFPVLLILLLMVGAKWSAARAGTLGFVVAAGIAVGVFGYGLSEANELTPVSAVGGALVEALFGAATIFWIVFPALCIFELQNRSGAFDVLRSVLTRLSAERRVIAILIAWFFALFLEGAAGFGTPVALAAPLLVSLGFAPLQAVTLALVGHAAGVSFGAVGTPIFPQMAATGFSALELAQATALPAALLGGILLTSLFLIAGQGCVPAARGGMRQWGWVCLAGPCFLVPFFLIATFVGPELPTLGGALVGAILFVAVLRWRRGVATGPQDTPDGGFGWALWRASLPYVVLLVLILATRLITPLQQLLQGIVWEWTLFGRFSGSVQPFYHPGSMLLLGFLVGSMLQGRRPVEVGVAVAHAAQRLLPAVIALVAMLALARVMVHGAMVSVLADTAAVSFGPIWPLIAPIVGALGGFITGSATASNVLLTNFQEATARSLGLPALQLVSAQGVGAAVGNIICPHNIIAGAVTVGMQGREAEILRRTLLVCVYYLAAASVLFYVLIAWTSD